MKCPQCSAENTDGKNFCSDCGSLLTPQLLPLIRAQVDEHVREHFRDQTVVDVETTEAIAERFVKWGKWFLIPATILITLLGVTLGIFGIRDFADVHKAAQQAISESNDATKKADEAKIKAQEAEGKADGAINAIDEATKKMGKQLTEAQKLSDKVSGLENKTASQIADASKHVEGRLTELDGKVEEANKSIVQQQSKLVSTNELVTAMFSKGQVENFATSIGNATNFLVVPQPAVGGNQKGAIVFMLLKSAPIFQTVQLNFHIFVQPKSSYFLRGNLITFFWGDPAESLKPFPLEVSYVPDPTYKGVVYSKLSLKDGHVFADDQQIYH
ncbi:MAG: zinc-ribbon domain-containing protein [Terriglobales bacterium]